MESKKNEEGLTVVVGEDSRHSGEVFSILILAGVLARSIPVEGLNSLKNGNIPVRIIYSGHEVEELIKIQGWAEDRGISFRVCSADGLIIDAARRIGARFMDENQLAIRTQNAQEKVIRQAVRELLR